MTMGQETSLDGASVGAFEAKTRAVLVGLKERLIAGEVERRDLDLLINFIGAALETDEGPEDQGFALFAVRAGCGHLAALVDQCRAETARLSAEKKALAEALENLLEATSALLSNEEHAVSGGMHNYQKGSPTWQLWADLRKNEKAAIAAYLCTKEQP
jgi:hypothetical protein